MKRKRLLFLATAMVMASSLWAQVMIETDLTSQFNSLATTKWTGSSGQVGWAAPQVTTNSGLTVAAWERYDNGCNWDGDIMYTTVKNLVKGTYRIELYGAAAFTFGRGFGSEAFTGDFSVDRNPDLVEEQSSITENTGVTLYATTSVGTVSMEIPIWYATNFNGSGLATAVLDGVEVGDDGQIKIGLSKTSRSTNWHVVQLKGVTALVNAQELLDKAVNDVNAISPLPASIQDYVNNQVNDLYKEYETADEYLAAIDALNALAEEVEAWVEPYAAWLEAKATAESDYAGNAVVEQIIADKESIVEAAETPEEITEATESLQEILIVVDAYTVMKEYAQKLYDVANYKENVAGAHKALGDAIDANSGTYATAEEFSAATAALKDAATTYAEDADPKDDAKFDLTFMLTNPDVTSFWKGDDNAGIDGDPNNHAAWNVRPEGWYNEQNGGNFQVMTNRDMAAGGEVFMEYWSGTAANSGFVLCQKVTLSEGAYQMTGRVGVQQYDGNGSTCNVTFSANDVDGTQIPYGGLTDGSIEFINDAKQEVKIGLKAHEGNNARWMAINKIHLYKIAPKPFVVSEEEDYDNTQEGAGSVALTRNIKVGLNSVVLPFQITLDDIEILGGEGAIAYTVTGLEGTSLKLAEATEAIQPNVPFFLKATEAGSSFELQGKTIVAGDPVITAGDAEVIGTYAAITVPEESYILSGGKFYFVDSEVSLKPTRAYISVAVGEAKVLTIDINDATAIEAIESTIANAQVYDLSGRKVQNPTRGLYIANGKKVLVK